MQALAQLPGLEEEAAAVLQNNGFALSMAAGQQPSRKALGELRKRAESSFLLNVRPCLLMPCHQLLPPSFVCCSVS